MAGQPPQAGWLLESGGDSIWGGGVCRPPAGTIYIYIYIYTYIYIYIYIIVIIVIILIIIFYYQYYF